MCNKRRGNRPRLAGAASVFDTPDPQFNVSEPTLAEASQFLNDWGLNTGDFDD
jgi:hypothetical protein